MDHAGAPAGIGAGVVDKEFMLTVWAPEFPLDDRKDYKVTLSFDGHPDIPVDGYRYEDMLIISFDRGEQAYPITHSSQVTVSVERHSHNYLLKRLVSGSRWCRALRSCACAECTSKLISPKLSEETPSTGKWVRYRRSYKIVDRIN